MRIHRALPTILAVAVSLCAAAPGMGPGPAVTFQVTGGRATALVQSQPGRPDLVMARTD